MSRTAADIKGEGTMKKLAWRIPLDILLLVLFTTIFSKNVISLMYHEAAGLALFALILVHIFFLNSAWVKGVACRLFQRKMPVRARIVACADILLGVSFLLIVISGVLISKKLFGFGLKAPWIVIHFFCSAFMVILIGVHIGLHWDYLKNGIAKRLPGMRLPKKAAMVLSTLICAFGVYSLFASSLGSWLARPFVAYEGHGESGYEQTAESAEGHGERGTRGGSGESQDRDASGDSSEGGESGHGQQAFSLARLLSLAATFFSIFFMIGEAVSLLDHGLTGRGRAGRKDALAG